MDKIFKELSIPIRVTLAVETEIDPFEKNVETVNLSSIPLMAIVNEISPAKAQWTMPGIITEKIKQVILRKIHRPLIERSQKITVKGDNSEYYGYRINGKLSIVEEQDYIRIYIYVKKEQ